MKLNKLFGALGLAFSGYAHALISIPMVQLPYLDPQPLRQMMAADDQSFSMDIARRTIERYVPPSVEIIGHPRSWLTIKADCYNFQTAEYCKRAFELIIATMELKQQLGLTKMLVITLNDIPYADPAPLNALVTALDYTNATPSISQEETLAILNRYLPSQYVVDTPPDSSFNYNRALCMFISGPTASGPWAPFYVYCREYAGQLAKLMQEKKIGYRSMLRSPFHR